MKLTELLEIIHRAYPDELTRKCWDAKKQRACGGAGDTLAEFVVGEIADTFDVAASDEAQLNEALNAMRWACTELTAVIAALEERKEANAKASEWPVAGGHTRGPVCPMPGGHPEIVTSGKEKP